MFRPQYINWAMAILMCCSLRAMAADWPTYQHDHRRSGYTTEQIDATRLAEAWVYRSAHAPAPAWPAPAKWDAYAKVRNLKSMRNYDPVFHPIAADDAVYFGSSVDDSVHCLDAATGETRWQFTTDGPVRIAPTYAEGRLYFGSDDGHAYCLDAKTGKLIWKTQAAEGDNRTVVNNGRIISVLPIRTGIMVESGTAYFGASLLPWKPSYLVAVDAKTGEVAGEGRYRKAFDQQFTFEGPMLAGQSQLIAPQGRIAPMLFDRKSGKSLGTLEGGGGCFVLVTPDDRIFHGPGNKEGWITESSQTSREKIASFSKGNAIVVQGGISFLLTDRSVTAVDREKKQRKWYSRCEDALTMVVAGDTMFIGRIDQVSAFDADSGKPLWHAEVNGRAYGLAVANGSLLVSTDEGLVYNFKASATEPFAIAATQEADDANPREVIEPSTEAGLLSQWVFGKDLMHDMKVMDLAGGVHAEFPTDTEFERFGAYEALKFDGSIMRSTVTTDYEKALLPLREMSATAWVRVDEPTSWGGIIGAIQDNGNFERGWILGYRDDRFAFGLASSTRRRLTYLTAPDAFEMNQWHHVAATYDGQKMLLYVDGKLAGQSSEQRGDIAYPPKLFYEIGAYHDDDESHAMSGALHEVRVYEKVLDAETIAKHYEQKKVDVPEKPKFATLAAGPILQFTSRDTAIVRWDTQQAIPSNLTITLGDQTKNVSDATPKKQHEISITGLKKNTVYQYQIQSNTNSESPWTAAYECDTHFNYSLGSIAVDGDAAVTKRAAGLLAAAGLDRGIAVVFGAEDGGMLAAEIADQSLFRVVCLETDKELVAAAREKLMAMGVYGARVSVRHVESFEQLPLHSHFANVVFAAAEHDGGEARRLLKPYGGVAVIDGGRVFVQKGIADAGVWSHQYGTPANAAFGGESLSDAGVTNELRVQWLGLPGPRGNPDRQPRKPAPLAVNGRLFVQGHYRMAAVDAFNGTLLWAMEIPPMARFNVIRDSANWCADDDFLYLAVEDECWQIAAGTGEIVQRMTTAVDGLDYAADSAEWSYIARAGDTLLGSTVPKGTSYVDWWGGEAWYDAKDGPLAAKVTSDLLFARDAGSGKVRWQYRDGIVINSSITATDEQLFFIEARNSELLGDSARRLQTTKLWSDMYMVAVDIETGEKAWEKKLDVKGGTASLSLAYSEGKLVLVTSQNPNYYVYCFAAADGKDLWKQQTPWFDGKDLGAAHHSTHLSRPAIVGGKVYVRPWIYSLADGYKFEERMPVIKEGHGCGTYAATTNALIFRSESVAMWNHKTFGKTVWPRLRPSCWLSTIPANGMLLSPEAGGGCSCGSWMETSIGFIPQKIKIIK